MNMSTQREQRVFFRVDLDVICVREDRGFWDGRTRNFYNGS